MEIECILFLIENGKNNEKKEKLSRADIMVYFLYIQFNSVVLFSLSCVETQCHFGLLRTRQNDEV